MMTKPLAEIFDFTQTSDACIKCGKCIPVCTIHDVNADEVTSPRGFIDLLGAYKRGQLELDENAKAIFESCFLCTNCVDVCPKSLPTDTIIEQVRSDIALKFGIAWYKRLFFYLLRHRKVMDIFFKTGYMFSLCALKANPSQNGKHVRVNLPLIKKDRLLPSIARKSFLNSHAEHIDNGGRKKVAIFIGCLANYSNKEVGESLLEILKTLNIDAFLAKSQKCCSAPAYFTGDFDTVDALAKANIEYFESFIDEVDAIIVPEATCSAMMAVDYEHYFHNQPKYQARARALKDKIMLATKYLYEHTALLEVLKTKPNHGIPITYHDPCHARKMQGVYEQPRHLLRDNYNLIEMQDSNACCGFGGITMQTQNFVYAQKVGTKKAHMIHDTQAQIVSAECSACKMQISNSLHANDIDVKFYNPIELIAQALKA